LFLTLKLSRDVLFRDGIALIGSLPLVFIAGFDGHISRIDGAALIAVYFFYLTILKSNDKNQHDNSSSTDYSGLKLILFAVI